MKTFTSDTKTWMAAEAREAPQALRRQAQSLAAPIAELAARLRRNPPQVVLTCARGSSAHAATFGKHLIERHIGIPVAAVAPNIASLYRRSLSIRHQLFIAVSQAGGSADIIESAVMAKAAGAITVAIVNDGASPLASASEIVLPIEAHAELSVAATKTFVASLAVLLRLVGSLNASRLRPDWTGRRPLLRCRPPTAWSPSDAGLRLRLPAKRLSS
jgi:glucosamine--fructose-6-phosphate aminotransferase (isomerizing)